MKKSGFIDIQVNGYMGVDFSADTLTEDDVVKAAQYLAEHGTAAFCPTLVTNSLDSYERNIPVLVRAARRPDMKSRVMGIHLEGPFVSPEEGARGAHPPAHIIPPSREIFDRFMDLAEGMISIITLAPEVEGVIDLIEHASSKGVVCSLGHHMADDEVMVAAVAAGAVLYTHLGNGIADTINRYKNPLWWALSCDKLKASFITDGQHLPDDFITVALRAKTSRGFIVTSDSMNLAGLPPGDYEFHGAKVTLSDSGRISLAGTPYLAGSSANMLDCMNHLASLGELDEAQLWDIGFFNPLRLLGKSLSDFEGNNEFSVEFVDNRFVVETTSAQEGKKCKNE